MKNDHVQHHVGAICLMCNKSIETHLDSVDESPKLSTYKIIIKRDEAHQNCHFKFRLCLARKIGHKMAFGTKSATSEIMRRSWDTRNISYAAKCRFCEGVCFVEALSTIEDEESGFDSYVIDVFGHIQHRTIDLTMKRELL